MQRQHEDLVRTASTLASDLKDDGMDDSQVTEMLFSSGFDADVVAEAMEPNPPARE
jgi:hypothetical protein